MPTLILNVAAMDEPSDRITSGSEDQLSRDPLNGRPWTRGRGMIDLAVLKVHPQCGERFSSYLFPSADDDVSKASGTIKYKDLRFS